MRPPRTMHSEEIVSGLGSGTRQCIVIVVEGGGPATGYLRCRRARRERSGSARALRRRPAESVRDGTDVATTCGTLGVLGMALDQIAAGCFHLGGRE
jgi:hypothetical protein